MFERLEVTRIAHALASHATARQSVIATNVAHADTPGYRARDVEDFVDTLRRTQPAPEGRDRPVGERPVGELPPRLARALPGHMLPGATGLERPTGADIPPSDPAGRYRPDPTVIIDADPGDAGTPNGNTVSIETEMMKAVEARHQFDMALNIYRSVSAVVRTSLGR